MPAKARYLFIAFLVVAAIVAGPKRVEPLWDVVRHDPVLGGMIFIIVLLLVMVIIRVIRR